MNSIIQQMKPIPMRLVGLAKTIHDLACVVVEMKAESRTIPGNEN